MGDSRKLGTPSSLGPKGIAVGNAALAFSAPLVFFALLEAALWLGGVRPLYLSEDPFVGFSSLQPLFVEEKAPDGSIRMTTSRPKLQHFNPQSFPRAKAPRTYRIFSVGGSTAYGHPWRDPVSFSGWLRELLPAADSSRTWEVINCGGISYASYREAKLIEELLAYQPDLFLVYSGHNEFLEERTYRKAAHLPAWLRETSSLLDHLRSYTVLRRLLRKAQGPPKPASGPEGAGSLAPEVDDILARTIGPTSYTRNDTLRADVLRHYRASLGRMARLAHSAGAEVLFLTTPGNEKDCSPFKTEITPGLDQAALEKAAAQMARAEEWKSRGRPDLAFAAYDSIARLDPRNAAVLYRAGQAALAAGAHARAKELFLAALDEDICPLRALTSMRSLVREAAEAEKAPWIDFTGVLEAKAVRDSGHGILGEPDFVDHVHLSIEDYRLLALTIIGKLKDMGVAHPGPGWGDAAIGRVSERVMARIDAREQGTAMHNLAKVINWAGKHEDAARIAEKGLALDSNGLEAIWSSLFVGAARERQGRGEEAIPHYRRAVRLDSNNPLSRNYLAAALQRLGRSDDAAGQFAAALRLNPSDYEARQSLGRLLLGLGRPAEALQHLRLALDHAPGNTSLMCLVGDAQLASGQGQAALAQYQRALQGNPREARALLGLGRVAEAQGDKSEAIRQYAQALNLDPGLEDARRALSRSLGGMSEAARR